MDDIYLYNTKIAFMHFCPASYYLSGDPVSVSLGSPYYITELIFFYSFHQTRALLAIEKFTILKWAVICDVSLDPGPVQLWVVGSGTLAAVVATLVQQELTETNYLLTMYNL